MEQQTEFEVQCPYCGEMIWMEFYPEDGECQEMVVDCEVCCNPILYTIQFSLRGRARLNVERAQ
jgi:Cysteine-rich CPXCG